MLPENLQEPDPSRVEGDHRIGWIFNHPNTTESVGEDHDGDASSGATAHDRQ